MVYNGYYKVMSNIPKMGHLPTPVGEDLFLSIFAVHFAVHGGFGTADLSFRKD
jgi:hypothetical protein